MTDFIEQVARAIQHQDMLEQGAPIEVLSDDSDCSGYYDQSRQAIAIIVERCGREADEHSKARITLKANALERKSKQEARDHESMAIEGIHIAAAIRTLAGGENNGGV